MGQKESGGAWTVGSFLGNGMHPEDAPQPIDEGIRLTNEPARTVAVIRYRGNDTETYRTEARRRLESHPRFKAKGDVWWAQYDAPFVIPFLVRNEAQVEVTDRRDA